MVVMHMVNLDTLFAVQSNYMVSFTADIIGSFLDCGENELICIWTNI